MAAAKQTPIATRVARLEQREQGVRTVLILGFISVIVAILVGAASGVSVVFMTQQTLLSAFQTGITLHENKPQ